MMIMKLSQLNRWLDRRKMRRLFWIWMGVNAIALLFLTVPPVPDLYAVLIETMNILLFVSMVFCCIVRMKLGQPSEQR